MNPVFKVLIVTPLVVAPLVLGGVYLGFYLGDLWLDALVMELTNL